MKSTFFFVFVYTCTKLHLCMYIYSRVYIYIFTLNVYLYLHTSTLFTPVSIYLSVSLYVCMYMYTYVNLHTCHPGRMHSPSFCDGTTCPKHSCRWSQAWLVQSYCFFFFFRTFSPLPVSGLGDAFAARLGWWERSPCTATVEAQVTTNILSRNM